MRITNEIDGLRSLSQVLTPTSLRKIAHGNDISSIDYRLKKHITGSKGKSYGDLLHSMYKALVANYRNEYIYKNTILNRKVLREYSLKETVVLDEFKIGASLADFVLINGEIRIYEIKTELDSLTKLKKQIIDYQKIATKIYVVCSDKHFDVLMNEFGNSAIGIIKFTKGGRLIEKKVAQNSLSHLNVEAIFKTLRKPEYLNIIKEAYNAIPNVPNTEIFSQCLELCRSMPKKRFYSLALNQLKTRTINCPDILNSKDVPSEFKYLCNSLNFSKQEYENLFSFLNSKITR